MKSQGSEFVRPEDLQRLATSAQNAGGQLATVCERLAIAVEVPRSEIDRAVENAVEAGRRLREAFWKAAEVVGVERPSWADRESLSHLVESFSDRLERLAKAGDRERLQALAEELRGGAIVDAKPGRRDRLEKLRAGAVGELDGALRGEVPTLPWPPLPVTSIVAWFAADDGSVERLVPLFPQLAEFLTMLDVSWWNPPSQVSDAAVPTDLEAKLLEPAALPGQVIDAPPPTAQSHRVDVSQARQVLRTATPNSLPAWVAAVPAGNSNVQPAPKPGPRFAATAALTTAPNDGSRFPLRSLPIAIPRTDERAPQSEAEGPKVTVVPEAKVAAEPAPAIPAALDSPVAATSVAARPPVLVRTPDFDFPRESDEFSISSEPAPAAYEPARMLSRELGSLKNFRDAYWRDERGSVVQAPWCQAGFDRKLEVSADRAMGEGRLAHLILFARAAEKLGSRGCPAPEDVRVLVGLLGGPRTTPAESEVRRTRLSELVSSPEFRASLATRLAVFLEAITQSPFSPLPPSQGREFAEAAAFSPALVHVLDCIFTVGSAEDEPLARLRAALQNMPKKSDAELATAVTKNECDLRLAIKTLWSAAGGKIERTHCRDAWQQFMTKAQVVFNELLDNAQWDDVRRLDGLLSEYTRIANRVGVKFSDRHRMDRAAGELVSKARAVITARREAGRRSRALQGRGLPELVEAYRQLPARDAASANDACFLALLDRLLARPDGSIDEAVGSIPLVEFYKRPALLEAVPTLSLIESRGVDAAEISDPLSAAAHLILDTEQPGDGHPSLSHHLRDIAREDLLAHVMPRSDTDAKFAADALGKAQALVTRRLAEVRSISVALDDLAHPAAHDVRTAINEAEKIIGEDSVHEAKPELLLAWLGGLHQFAHGVLDESIPGVQEAFSRRSPSPDEIVRFDQALARRQYVEILALARGEGDAPLIEDRATLWRRTAAAEFPEPRRTLKNLRSRHEELCRLWLSGVCGNGTDETLRQAFVRFVFDVIALVRAHIKEPKGRPETQVSMGAVRNALAALALNPSFVPQVTSFRDISVLTPPTSPNENTFVRSTTELLARGTDGKMTVLLAPGISSNVRDQLREELRRRSSSGVGIIDDLDLVRLLNPGRQEVNPILALLEIVLEQQSKWSQVNPFESHEGQHTKQEMFVGRKEEAEALWQRGLYSRVFSGRRLGKSALLKHIYDSQDKARLPSGNRLRVVYVPIVGLDNEDAVVRNIIKAFGSGLLEPPPGLPAERLKAFVESYLRKEKSGSVLVFLDEADTFVEAQVKQYDKDRERSLTWRMRSELEHDRDTRDLPRVRFVFAGYRATHRPEGAWANWGDVLRLRPLSRNDAARLIAGPLARLGINATSEASAIAYRCGYQPAILVRFGQQLIEYLDNTITPARRDAVVVTSEQVAAVYQNPAVHQEIRTIVWNNFQGNPLGQIVFSALLLEFARMPPGAALDDAPSRVLQRLRSLVPSFMADESLDGPAVDRIARTLRDFVDRSLIDEVHPTTRSYRLRFPHQLHVLLQEDQEALIRREAAALGGERLDAIEDVRSLVPRGALEDLAHAAGTEGYIAGVVASHWLDAVERRAANVAARLGYVNGEIVDLFSEPEDLNDPKRRRLALMKASPEAAARTLRERGEGDGEDPLFVGGMDLLRWGLRRYREDRDVELATVPRLTTVQLRWWFERVCEINWSGASPLPLFMQKTGGIPYLVALLDRELGRIVGLEGASASDAHIEQAVASYANSLERAGRELVTGDPTIALERREQELLIMVAMASRLASDSSTSKQRSDLLEILYSPHDYAAIVPGLERFQGLTSGDALALDVLLRSGLLVSESKANRSGSFDRLGVLPPEDPAILIAAVVDRCLST